VISDMLAKWLSLPVVLYGVSANKLDCPGLFKSSEALIPGLKSYVSAMYVPPLFSVRVQFLKVYCRLATLQM
jgi:hypothetical protein